MCVDEDGKQSSDRVNEEVDLHQLTLEEIRLRYQEEEQRRTAVEAKISTVLTVDAIIVSVTGVFSDINFILGIAIVLALLSVYIGIRALWVRDYSNPGRDVEDYLKYIDQPRDKIQRKIVIDYITAITGNEVVDDPELYQKGNRTKNDEKFDILDKCLKLTLFSLGCVLLHPIPMLF
jgi:hypothetical protein